MKKIIVICSGTPPLHLKELTKKLETAFEINVITSEQMQEIKSLVEVSKVDLPTFKLKPYSFSAALALLKSPKSPPTRKEKRALVRKTNKWK